MNHHTQFMVVFFAFIALVLVDTYVVHYQRRQISELKQDKEVLVLSYNDLCRDYETLAKECKNAIQHKNSTNIRTLVDSTYKPFRDSFSEGACLEFVMARHQGHYQVVNVRSCE